MSRRLAVVLGGLLAALLCACSPAATSLSGTGGPGATAPGSATTVVGLGDSVMASTNCGCDGIVPEYAAALARRDHRSVVPVDLASNGAVTEDVLTDDLGNVAHRDAVALAGVVLLTLGANDLLPQLEKWRSSSCDSSCYGPPIRAMGQTLGRVLARIHAVRAGSTGPVLVTDYWNVFTDGEVARRDGGAAQVRWSAAVTAAANAAICSAARANHAVCVDLVAPFKGSTDTNRQQDPTPLLADDGDHPNAAGVKVIVRALMAHTPT